MAVGRAIEPQQTSAPVDVADLRRVPLQKHRDAFARSVDAVCGQRGRHRAVDIGGVQPIGAETVLSQQRIREQLIREVPTFEEGVDVHEGGRRPTVDARVDQGGENDVAVGYACAAMADAHRGCRPVCAAHASRRRRCAFGTAHRFLSAKPMRAVFDECDNVHAEHVCAPVGVSGAFDKAVIAC